MRSVVHTENSVLSHLLMNLRNRAVRKERADAAALSLGQKQNDEIGEKRTEVVSRRSAVSSKYDFV